ncbi:gamma-aminobutyric acid receptor subunit beta isoform X2 [Folsomia candida]|nr:gamma-aminobutyric acid receptor subunit beta isoform X2 [Folsomia candida]
MTLTMDVFEEWTHSNSVSVSPEVRINRNDDAQITNETHDKRTDYDVAVVNARESTILKTLMRSDGNGSTTKLTKLEITTSCSMNFFYFPFDKQTCAIKIIPGESSSKKIAYAIDSTNHPLTKITELDNLRLYSLTKYKISQGVLLDEFGVYNQSSIEIQLMFYRQFERSLSFLYFPVVALMTISCMALFVKPNLHSVYITLASFMTMVVWIISCDMTHAGFTTMLDHYHFLCLNLSLNAVSVALMIHLFMQSGTSTQKSSGAVLEKSESDQSDNFTDVKLELNSITTSNTTNGYIQKTNKDDEEIKSENDPEAHIRAMGKFKQFIYFKSAKPAKYQLPIIFTLINVIYAVWIIIARVHTPSGFESF